MLTCVSDRLSYLLSRVPVQLMVRLPGERVPTGFGLHGLLPLIALTTHILAVVRTAMVATLTNQDSSCAPPVLLPPWTPKLRCSSRCTLCSASARLATSKRPWPNGKRRETAPPATKRRPSPSVRRAPSQPLSSLAGKFPTPPAATLAPTKATVVPTLALLRRSVRELRAA